MIMIMTPEPFSAKWVLGFTLVGGTRGNTETTQYVESWLNSLGLALTIAAGLQNLVLIPPQIFP